MTANPATQNRYLAKTLSFVNTVTGMLLDKSDMLSLYSCKKLVRTSAFVRANLMRYLTEESAAAIIFIAVNIGILTYQYTSGWFTYYTTTPSGLRKLYKMIFQNPLMLFFWYGSFYFQILDNSDKETINSLAKFSNLFPEYASEAGRIQTLIVTKLQGIYADKLSLSEWLESVLFRSEPELKRLDNLAIYIEPDTVEKKSDIDEFYDFVISHRQEIEKTVSKEAGKKKRRRAALLKSRLEKKTETGETMCLDECEPRIKTDAGFYCESDCGKTAWFLKQNPWCYVDPQKYTKADRKRIERGLEKTLGRYYDTCNPEQQKTRKCFTGLHYQDC